jgi:hypothetical protein
MWRFLALGLLLPLIAAADDWVEYKTGAFEVWTNANQRDARIILNHLEQVRHVLGQTVKQDEIKPVWPVRVLVMRNARPLAPVPARDTYISVLDSRAPIPREWMAQLVRILIEDGARRMPPDIEAGLIAFYSTTDVNGVRVTLGVPVPPAERNLAWARIHLLQTDPEYSGKIRVMLYNLQHGVDAEPAFRNAFGKTPQQIEQQAAAHLAAGQFATALGNSKPINAQRDFRPSFAAPNAAIAMADLKLATKDAGARAAYEQLASAAPAVANEGLGLLAADPGERKERLAAATRDGSKSARAWLEYARLLDGAERHEALMEAQRLNPLWAEPYVFRASYEKDPEKRLEALQMATKLAPRDASLWRSLAEQCLAMEKYGDAARAWAAAAQAATSDEERQQIRAARQEIENRRLEWQAAERRRLEEERERAMRELREKAMAEIRAAEARANAAAPPLPPDLEIVPMFEGPAPEGRVRGRIIQVECIPPMARLTVQVESGTVRLLAREPAKILVSGDPNPKFECEQQAEPRLAVLEFYPNVDDKTGTTGDIASIEYLAEAQPSPDAPATPRRKKLGDQ